MEDTLTNSCATQVIGLPRALVEFWKEGCLAPIPESSGMKPCMLAMGDYPKDDGITQEDLKPGPQPVGGCIWPLSSRLFHLVRQTEGGKERRTIGRKKNRVRAYKRRRIYQEVSEGTRNVFI